MASSVWRAAVVLEDLAPHRGAIAAAHRCRARRRRRPPPLRPGRRCPRATTSRAATSASTIATPSLANASATALLPDATPPVRPMVYWLMRDYCRAPQGSACERDAPPRAGAPCRLTLAVSAIPRYAGRRRPCRAPEEHDPAGDGEIGAEGNRRGAVAALRRQPDRSDDRADQRGQQDRRHDALQPDPGAERRQQLEVAVAHAFLAGELLEQPLHRPERQVADHRADDRRLGSACRAHRCSRSGPATSAAASAGRAAAACAGRCPTARPGSSVNSDRAEALPAEAEAPDAKPPPAASSAVRPAGTASEIGASQCRHLPRSASQLTSGMFSHHDSWCLQCGQCERSTTMPGGGGS